MEYMIHWINQIEWMRFGISLLIYIWFQWILTLLNIRIMGTLIYL